MRKDLVRFRSVEVRAASRDDFGRRAALMPYSSVTPRVMEPRHTIVHTVSGIIDERPTTECIKIDRWTGRRDAQH